MIINVKFNNFFWMHNLSKNEAILKIKTQGYIFYHFSLFIFAIPDINSFFKKDVLQRQKTL